MQFTFLTTLSLSIATPLAAPEMLKPSTSTLADLDPNSPLSLFRTLVPAPNAQNCLSEKHGVGSTTRVCYTITIGAVFDEGKGCDAVHDRVEGATLGRLNDYTWECSGQSGEGNADYTKLYFCLLGSKDVSRMNEELGEAYPMVDGFNCSKD